MTNLSEHFTIEEFEYSDTAKAYKINNKMNNTQINEAKHTCIYLLEKVRSLANQHYVNKLYKNKIVANVSMKITSGFRCLQLNRLLGSKDTSEHTLSRAVDFEFVVKFKDGSKSIIPYTETYELIKTWVKLKYIKVNQCIQEKSGQSTWVHISLASQIKDCKNQFLKYDGNKYIIDN